MAAHPPLLLASAPSAHPSIPGLVVARIDAESTAFQEAAREVRCAFAARDEASAAAAASSNGNNKRVKRSGRAEARDDMAELGVSFAYAERKMYRLIGDDEGRFGAVQALIRLATAQARESEDSPLAGLPARDDGLLNVIIRRYRPGVGKGLRWHIDRPFFEEGVFGLVLAGDGGGDSLCFQPPQGKQQKQRVQEPEQGVGDRGGTVGVGATVQATEATEAAEGGDDKEEGFLGASSASASASSTVPPAGEPAAGGPAETDRVNTAENLPTSPVSLEEVPGMMFTQTGDSRYKWRHGMDSACQSLRLSVTWRWFREDAMQYLVGYPGNTTEPSSCSSSPSASSSSSSSASSSFSSSYGETKACDDHHASMPSMRGGMPDVPDDATIARARQEKKDKKRQRKEARIKSNAEAAEAEAAVEAATAEPAVGAAAAEEAAAEEATAEAATAEAGVVADVVADAVAGVVAGAEGMAVEVDAVDPQYLQVCPDCDTTLCEDTYIMCYASEAQWANHDDTTFCSDCYWENGHYKDDRWEDNVDEVTEGVANRGIDPREVFLLRAPEPPRKPTKAAKPAAANVYADVGKEGGEREGMEGGAP